MGLGSAGLEIGILGFQTWRGDFGGMKVVFDDDVKVQLGVAEPLRIRVRRARRA